jgi:MFS family permease
LSSSAPLFPSFRWYATWLPTAFSILNDADRAVIAAVLPLIRSELNLSDVMLRVRNAGFRWSYAIASPESGYIADRLPRVRVIPWSLIGGSVETLLAGVVASAQQLRLALHAGADVREPLAPHRGGGGAEFYRQPLLSPPRFVGGGGRRLNARGSHED